VAKVLAARWFAVLAATVAVCAWTTLDVVTDGPLRAWDRAVIGVPAPAAGPEPVGWRILVDVGGA
jgi:hypothetical protein